MLAIALVFFSGTTVQAATYSWTGAVNNLWSQAGNWAGGVPAAGDTLVFPSGAANLSNTNDLVGLSLASIVFNGRGYTVGGNGIVLTGTLSSLDDVSYVALNLPIDVQANAVTIGGNRYASFAIAGNLSGTGPITVSGGVLVTFSGSHAYSAGR